MVPASLGDGLFVSPIAAPGAATIAVRTTPMPTATSQPKKSAPQLKPPKRSRARTCAPRFAATAPVVAAASRRTGASVRSRVTVPFPSVVGRSAVATPPRSSYCVSAGALRPHRLSRPNICLPPRGLDVPPIAGFPAGAEVIPGPRPLKPVAALNPCKGGGSTGAARSGNRPVQQAQLNVLDARTGRDVAVERPGPLLCREYLVAGPG